MTPALHRCLLDRPPLPAVWLFDETLQLPLGFDLPAASFGASPASLLASSPDAPGGVSRDPRPEIGGRLLRRRVARALAARTGVARGLGLDATAFAITTDALGAPWVEPARAGLHVSFAHRQDLSAIALGPTPIGVDLEPDRDRLDLPLALLHPAEAKELMALPEERRCRAFLKLWTLKEAYVKALGVGFGLSPEAFRIEGFAADISTFRVGDATLTHWLTRPVRNPAGASGVHVALALRPG